LVRYPTYLMLAERLLNQGLEYAAPWNFGPDRDSEQPVSYLVDLIARIWGKDARWEVDSRPQPHEAKVLRLDSTKARTLLHWRPRLSLRKAIELTMEWYIAGQKTNDTLRDLTLRQVRSFAGASQP
jgi:CDP-glucose 4,6-dehydratase